MSACKNAGRALLDPAPLRAVILKDAERLWSLSELSLDQKPERTPGLSMLARELDWGERSLRRILFENQTVTEDIADRYCIATNRHLSEVYPEVYDDADLWFAQCPGCDSQSHRVSAEGPLRMDLRCCVCGRVWRIHRYPERRSWSNPTAHALPREQILKAHAEYQETSESAQVIGDRYGCAGNTLIRWWHLLGLPVRKPGAPISREMNELGVLLWRAKAWRKRLQMLRLRQEGLGCTRIAKRLSMTEQGVCYSLRQLEREPASERTCPDHGTYPTPPRDILSVAPDLAHCPKCALQGDFLKTQDAA